MKVRSYIVTITSDSSISDEMELTTLSHRMEEYPAEHVRVEPINLSLSQRLRNLEHVLSLHGYNADMLKEAADRIDALEENENRPSNYRYGPKSGLRS